MNTPIVTASPSASLTERQAQRAEALRLVIELVAGRSVPISVVADLARWVYAGEPS